VIARRCLWCFGLAAFLFCAACGKQSAPPKARERPNLILVSIDTLRADHVGVRGLTPRLDALATKSVTFLSAWSQVPLTLPSHSSILTGLLPTHHGVRDNLGYELRAETLAETFKKNGFATGGFVSATVLRHETGIARGFDVFDEPIPTGSGTAGLERPGSATVEKALAFVKGQATTPFFLFVHLYEPHTPYAAPERFRGRGSSAYDHEVAAADEIVGALLDGVEALAPGRPGVVVTSDHGEGLGDHGEDEHGLLLYSESLHVPLIVSWPDGRKAGTRVVETVRLVDIAPTLLEMASLSLHGGDGASLDRSISEGSRPAYSETWYPKIHLGWSELSSVVEGKWHWIAGPKPELYNLDTDPGETRNLSGDPALPGAAMARYLADQRKSAGAESVGEASREAEERLRALGYLGSRSFASKASGDNPRDKMAFYQPFMKAFTAAHTAQEAGELKRAIEEYRKAIALVASEGTLVIPKIHSSLADCLARLDQAAAAEHEFKLELKQDPTSIEGRTGLGTLFWSQGRDAEARETISGIVEKNGSAGHAEYAAVIRAFEVLGDAPSAAEWRGRAQAKGFLR
jgi:choline-sulfatase